MFDLFNNQGIALAVFGYFGFMLKDLPMRLWQLLKQRYSTTIKVTSEDSDKFMASHQWVMSIYPMISQHATVTNFNCKGQKQIAEGMYYLFLDWFTLGILNCHMIDSKNYIYYALELTVVGCKRSRYKELHQQYMAEHAKLHNDELRVSTFKDRDRLIHYVPRKSFEDVYFKQKDQILDFISTFTKNKPIYKKHGVAYKTGILFYGPPGSGKSTLARAIATYLNWEIVVIDVKTLIYGMPYINDKTIVLIEDIDCLVKERFSATKKEEAGLLDMHTLLNYIDGVMSPSNCIFIATTNYIERIDPALIRPGRFDLCLEVPHADKNTCQEMCDRYKVGYELLDDIEFPVSLAVVQNKIFSYLLKKGR